MIHHVSANWLTRIDTSSSTPLRLAELNDSLLAQVALTPEQTLVQVCLELTPFTDTLWFKPKESEMSKY